MIDEHLEKLDLADGMYRSFAAAGLAWETYRQRASDRRKAVETEINRLLDTPVAQTETSWIDPIASYLLHGTVPADRSATRKYVIIDGWLYRISYTLPYLSCLRPSEAELVLRDTHEGLCGEYLGGRAVA